MLNPPPYHQFTLNTTNNNQTQHHMMPFWIRIENILNLLSTAWLEDISRFKVVANKLNVRINHLLPNNLPVVDGFNSTSARIFREDIARVDHAWCSVPGCFGAYALNEASGPGKNSLDMKVADLDLKDLDKCNAVVQKYNEGRKQGITNDQMLDHIETKSSTCWRFSIVVIRENVADWLRTEYDTSCPDLPLLRCLRAG